MEAPARSHRLLLFGGGLAAGVCLLWWQLRKRARCLQDHSSRVGDPTKQGSPTPTPSAPTAATPHCRQQPADEEVVQPEPQDPPGRLVAAEGADTAVHDSRATTSTTTGEGSPSLGPGVQEEAGTSQPEAKQEKAKVEKKRGKEKDKAVKSGFLTRKSAKPARQAQPGQSAAASAAAPEGKPRKLREEEKGEVGQARAKGLSELKSGRAAEAQAAFRQMLELAREAGRGRAEGRAWRLLARALEAGQAAEEEIEDAFSQALKLAHNQDDMELSFSVLTGMGSRALNTGDPDMAEHFFLQSKMLAKRVLTDREEAIAEGNLGKTFARNPAQQPEALEHLKKAVELQESAGRGRSAFAVKELHSELQAWGEAGDQGKLLGRAAALLGEAELFGDWELDL